MVNIQGLYKFRDFFQKYTDNYVLIGGTACSILFDEIGKNFRATKVQFKGSRLLFIASGNHSASVINNAGHNTVWCCNESCAGIL